MASKLLCAVALQLAVVDAKIPVKEVPRYSNKGKRVEQYQTTAGVAPPEPYCASALFTWFHEACGIVNAVNPLLRTGYCPSAVDHLKRTGRGRKKNTDAKPGDAVFYWIVSEGRHGHCAIVLKNNGDGTIQAVEANTNDNGSPDGDGVYFKTRRLAGTRHFVADLQNVLGTLAAPKIADPNDMTQVMTTAQMGSPIRQAKVTIDGVPVPSVLCHSFLDHTYVGIGSYAEAMKGKQLSYGEFDGHTLTLNLITK
jgi:hypothetical protein